MLNIVLPMAGRGTRFADAGYAFPKPLIPIHSVPMIKVVVDNLTPKCEHRFIFIYLLRNGMKIRVYYIGEEYNGM